MKLLISQKNDIFDIIVDEGFDPAYFKFSEEKINNNEIVTYLRYKSTKYYFMFRSTVSGFQTMYSPALRYLEEEESTRGGWKQFSTRIRKWLKFLKQETNTLNKWDTFKNELQQIPFTFSYDDNNEKFSFQELKIIKLKIDDIKNEIKNLELSHETIKLLNTKFDSLYFKACKLSKTDWKELFIGAIIGVILNLAIPPKTSEAIWEIIRNSFQQFILP